MTKNQPTDHPTSPAYAHMLSPLWSWQRDHIGLWFAWASPKWFHAATHVTAQLNGQIWEIQYYSLHQRMAEASHSDLHTAIHDVMPKINPQSPHSLRDQRIRDSMWGLYQYEQEYARSIPPQQLLPDPPEPSPKPEWFATITECDWEFSQDQFGRWIAQAVAHDGATVALRDNPEPDHPSETLYLSAPGPFHDPCIELYARNVKQALEGCIREAHARAKGGSRESRDTWKATRDFAIYLLSSLPASTDPKADAT